MHRGIPVLFSAILLAVAWLAGPTASSPAREAYEVDAVHSVVLFRIQHLGVSYFYGRFNDIAGSFNVSDEGAGAVDITIRADSIDTNSEKRDGHLKSPDFLSVKQFPTITFKSERLVRKGGKRYQATGTLTLHGVSKEITVDLERVGSANAMGAYRTGFEGSFLISRSAHGMSWRPEALGDEIKLIVAIEGTRQ
ncbi:MAG: YceI family protein [Planctomycetota bacterium]|jgi:polyisoprenoid-binding protein YceI